MKRPVERALLACAQELDALDADWAIGGAVAMGVHGYERATNDVDVFVGDDAREDFIAALARRGIELVATMAPIHYSIIPDTKRPDERVDLLFPALGVESLAIMAATREKVAGKRLPVWPMAHLAAHKLVTDPAIDPERATAGPRAASRPSCVATSRRVPRHGCKDEEGRGARRARAPGALARRAVHPLDGVHPGHAPHAHGARAQ